MAAARLVAAMLFIGLITQAAPAADVTDAEALAILQTHCVMCHARTPTHPSFDAPPKDVMLETIDELKAWAIKVREQVVLDRNMPVGNETGMTEAEREAIDCSVAKQQ